MSDAIIVEGLKKSFGKIEAVADVSFTVRQGELFGFLGPNGAGKTTTINILTGLARPDSGKFSINGLDCINRPRSAQHLIGVVPDESNMYPELTGYENLCFCGALYGINKFERQSRAEKLLKDFGLTEAANRKFSSYSKGMKRKLTIAAGIIHQPKILFLDEPTTGIDVASTRQLRQLISDLHNEGITIFLTTHQIDEAERLCDRIAFIVSGHIVRIDTTKNLLQPVQDKHVLQIFYTTSLDDIKTRLSEKFSHLEFIFPEHGIIRVESNEAVRAGSIIHYLEEQEIEVLEARRIKPSLEDVFVKITGIEADIMRKEKGSK